MPQLTGVQFTVLIYLYYHQKSIVTQRDVINYLHLRHPTVRHIIKLMLKKRLIVSGSLPSDHRQVQLMISRGGNQLIKSHLNSINHDFKRINHLMTDHMSPREVQTLERTLGQLIKNFKE